MNKARQVSDRTSAGKSGVLFSTILAILVLKSSKKGAYA